MVLGFIWIGYAISLIGILIISCFLTKYERFKNKMIRNSFLIAEAIVEIVSFLLVFIEQPWIEKIFINFVVGIPITFFGITGRIYASSNDTLSQISEQKKTTTALDRGSSVIKSDPTNIFLEK